MPIESSDIINKKILFIVPHQDDEINLAGGTIYTLSKHNDVKIVYTTNGDYCTHAKTRYREAIKACKELGVNKKNIVFLGYPDTSYNSKTHMYTSKHCVTSQSGHSHTYGVTPIHEYCYVKHKIHHEYTIKNLISDIKELLSDYTPDIIFCTDLDFHPDHIMTSICFEKALGQILNTKNNTYKPLVFKTFCYENCYAGPNDFNQKRSIKTLYKLNKAGCCINNPYYQINDLKEFSINHVCYSRFLILNPIWRAINKHKSQLLVNSAFRIINANNSFWQRNTQNLLNIATVRTSSSDQKLLHDFVINDTNNILHGDKQKIIYDRSIWIPKETDKKREIKIELPQPTYIAKLNLYSGNNGNPFIEKISLSLDGNKTTHKIKNPLEIIPINNQCQNITIKILDQYTKNGFSEIELIGEKTDAIEYNKNAQPNDSGNNFIFFLNKLYLRSKIFETKIIRKFLLRRSS